ncbi:MAG: carbohydrate-binding domain-containing protein [Firmicutes bacterium]|nr:carbohydrate-binding domain-containing protein [Bacillota bacterium]
MKKLLPFLLTALLLTGCASSPETVPTVQTTAATSVPTETVSPETTPAAGTAYVSRFDSETAIVLSDGGITVNGGGETQTVFTSHDIVYYENKTAYDSGNPYGDGGEGDMHTAEEADAHTVVNITAPGAYRLSGTLSAGQIRVDLGEDAASNPEAVVELILDGADITCTVAPAILFQNVYECDGDWDAETAQATVDTANAGANLILAENSRNVVSGSYVAKIYKDAEGEKKLVKQDGAIYSYMSMNVYGPGALDLTAENEGLDTELHLTIQGGDIAIRADNDGINTNEDGVSVTTINGGNLHIIAGLGAEGDGIDSNGYLVINGGTVVASANPASDAGLDSDKGSFVNGGTVIALGSTMDWAESDSAQVTMNLQFADYQSSGSAIVVKNEDGDVIFAYDPSEDEVLGENMRRFQGAVISCPAFAQGQNYTVWLDGTVTGEETGGVYASVTAYDGGTQLQYTGTDVARGGMGGMRPAGEKPEGFDGEHPQKGDKPEDFTRPAGEQPPERPDGETSATPEGKAFPEGERPTLPEGETMPEGEPPEGFAPGGMDDASGEPSTAFYMQDMVNAFSGISPVSK